MKKDEPYQGFEQGRIRPPSESGSLLIRVSRNCPWNRCTFCNLYKDTKFSLRPVDHILKDIDLIRDSVKKINNGEELKPQSGPDEMAAYAAMNWVQNGMKSVFLQDSNSLLMKPDELVEVLQYLSDTFPEIERITSYARSHTIARISAANLKRMATAGLNRIHVGLESASDTVLAMVKKGTDKAMQIRLLMSAGSSPDAWELRCAVRERLIGYLQRHRPESLPRFRIDKSAGTETVTAADNA